MNKAIFKFNDGNGALLCSACRAIIKTSKDYTDIERGASNGYYHMDERYCYKCAVSNYPVNNKYGFTQEEILDLLKDFPTVNMDKFNNALMGNTCMMIDDELIQYHCDIDSALRCGIEDRELRIDEWD